MVRASPLIALALALGAGSALAQPTGAELNLQCLQDAGFLHKFTVSYQGCMIATATKLEPSGATTTEITAAARGTCGDEAIRMRAYAYACDRFLSSAFGSRFSDWAANNEHMAAEYVAREVLEARAKRNTK